MLDSFKELLLNYQDTYQSDLILWNNENITIEGESLFLEKMGQKGKLLYSRHFKWKLKILTYEEFKCRCSLQVTFLHYFQMR